MSKTTITKDNLDLISDISNVGIWWEGETTSSERKRGFIVRVQDGSYAGMDRRCDLGYVWTRKCKRDYAEAVIGKTGKNKIYLFSTTKELFNWLNNDNSV